MSESIAVQVNCARVEVPAGATVAVAMMLAGAPARISVSGQPRMAFCAMGICFECRCEIDGEPHRRGCQVLCAPGMNIRTNG